MQLHQKSHGIIFILSDFSSVDSQKFKQIATLAKNNKVCCINIFDVLEEIAPPNDIYNVIYKSQKLTFSTFSDSFKSEYQQYFAKKREVLRNNCQKFLCSYMEIRTDIPIFKQLRLI